MNENNTDKRDLIPAQLRVNFHEARPVDLDTEQIRVNKYHILVHNRHDLLHHLVNVILSLPDIFTKEQTLRGEFEGILPDELLKYSPDIVLLTSTHCLVADVSCTWNREFHLAEKKSKYDAIVQSLRSETDLHVPDFYMFWVDPSWSNLVDALEEFYSFLSTHSILFTRLKEDKIEQVRIAHEDISEALQRIRQTTSSELLYEDSRAPVKETVIDTDLLKAKSSSVFCHFDRIQESILGSTFQDVEAIFEELVTDPDVINQLKDTRHNEDMFENAFKILDAQEDVYSTGPPKPTFFVPFADFNVTISDELASVCLAPHLEDLKKEQRQVLQMLTFATQSGAITDVSVNSSLKKILEETLHALKNDGEKNLFNTGMLTGSLEREISLNKMYTEHRTGHDSSLSKRQFFKQALGSDVKLRDTLPYVFKNKCIKLTAPHLNTNTWFAKSGTAFKKSHEVREYKQKVTVGREMEAHMQDFMDLLNMREDKPYKTHPFLGTESGPDAEFCKNIKSGFLDKQKDFLSLIQHTKAHSFSKHTSTIVSQLLHFNELNTSPNTFCLMSGGRQNSVHIVRGGSLKRGQDVGQAFFTVFVTHDLKWASTVYGRIKVYPVTVANTSCFLCVTPWVRLSSTKLSFMKDQYYSTLSTAYDSWTRVRDLDMNTQTLQMIYTFRVCVSLCPSQRVAELLMDTRYIVMAALSTYSNVFELIVDKFPPPYSNVMEKHIVIQLRKKCSQIVKHFRTNPPQANKPGYSLNKRLQTTLGGKFTMPSLWSEEIVRDMQGLFDELFVYVHTSKEPSSNYHEQVRAMNTILKFQKQYNTMDETQQSGTMSSKQLREWILSGNQIGCHAPTVYWGAKVWGQKYEGLNNTVDFREMCLTEPLSELESTKACIPEVARKTVVKEKSRTEMDRVIANLGSLFKTRELGGPSPLNTYFKIDVDMSEDVEMVITQNLRVKVHDSLLDWIKRSKSKTDFTLDLAMWNITNNDMRVIADTCIKAQYGAKREFYVINLGAKGMARVLENSYKCLAKRCRNEMISVPGDKKLEHIQLSVNEIILASERRQDKIFYTNGDCTKWSACETMASFVAFNSGLSNVFGEKMTAFNNAVFSSWANKEIQIPQSILSNLKYMSDQTNYITEETTIKSTQNFLQGMFNYASSLKAVAATEFALHMFKKMNPTEMIFCTHLEHSDDYSLVTRVKDDSVFEKFRVYHKLAQKLFGINDSTKKTNVQKYFLEFISLFSFNGQLFYPNIKKTKEVGTNLPCTNFKNDVMSVTSRTAEAVRLGVSLESCYFLQRVHCASLADAYSMTPGMKNSYGSITDCFSTPMELFGFPDCLPVLHYVVRGSPESYRLYNFGGKDVQDLYKKLFIVAQETRETDDLPYLEYASDLGEFFSPNFSYPTRHNRLRKIKTKLNITLEDSRDYFQSNLTDTLVKPAESSRFSRWLEAMYYNKSFSQAYMSVSRATMTLRHSMFSSKPCIQPFDTLKKSTEDSTNLYFWTVKQHYLAMKSYPLTDEKSAELSKSTAFKLSVCSYSQTIGMYYEFFETSRLIQAAYVDTHTTVSKSPTPYQAVPLENRVQLLLQFMINPENFYSDRRKFLSETSLYRDIDTLAQNYNLSLLRKDMGYARQVMKELISQNPPSSYGLVYNTNDSTPLGYMIQYLCHGLFTGETFRVVPSQKTTLSTLRPEKIKFVKDWKSNSDTFTEALYEIALMYRAIKLRCQSNFSEQIEKLMTYEIPELSTTVSEFLTAVSLNKLVSYKVGENAQKILSFMKMAILNDLSDMRTFLNGRLFYEFHYMSKNHCPQAFDEACTIRFQGVCCNAFLKKSSLEKPTIILEVPNTNKVLWFYFYTIAERLFGSISQVQFDMRMMNTHDMALKPVGRNNRNLLDHVKITSRDPMFFKMVGKVILPTTEYIEATLPIVVQKTNFSHARFSIKEDLGVISDYSIEGLSVYMGTILMYTLPFGNLYSRNILEKKSPTDDKCIFIDGIPLTLLQDSGRLIGYLKSDFTQHYQVHEIEENLERVWKTGLSEFEVSQYKIENLGEMFDLDLVRFPNPEWKPAKKGNIVTDYMETRKEVDFTDDVPMVPVVFDNSKHIMSKDDFQTSPLEMSNSDLGVPRDKAESDNPDTTSDKKKENKKRTDLVNSAAGTQSESLESFMEMFERVSKRVKEKKEKESKIKDAADVKIGSSPAQEQMQTSLIRTESKPAEPKQSVKKTVTDRQKMMAMFDFSKSAVSSIAPADQQKDKKEQSVPPKPAKTVNTQDINKQKMLAMFDFSKTSVAAVALTDQDKPDRDIEDSAKPAESNQAVKKIDIDREKMMAMFDFSKSAVSSIIPENQEQLDKDIEESLKSEGQQVKKEQSKPAKTTKPASAQDIARQKMLSMFDFSKTSVASVAPTDQDELDRDIEESLKAESKSSPKEGSAIVEEELRRTELETKDEEKEHKKEQGPTSKTLRSTQLPSKMLGLFDFSSLNIAPVAPTNLDSADKQLEESLKLQDKVESSTPKKAPVREKSKKQTELEEKLLNSVKIDFDVEVVEGDFEVDLMSTFGNVGLVHGKVSEESLLKQKRIKEYTDAVHKAANTTIEDIRDQIKLDDASEEELGELFETVPPPHQYEPQSDSSSDDSLTNENQGYYQMVEHPALLEQGYRFERRAREALQTLPDYLLDCWIKPDLVQMFQNSNELGNLIKLFSGILTNHRRMNLDSKQRSLIKATLRGMEKMLGSTIDPYMFSQSKAVTFDKGKITFLAVASYSTREERKAVVDRSPKIKPVHGIENHTSNRFWVKAPLRQKDFDAFLKTNNGEINLQTRTRLSSMLSQFIPELKEVELDLEEDYGF